MSRRKAREIVLCLVFEKDYHKDLSCEKLYEIMTENGQVAEIYNSFSEETQESGNTGIDNSKPGNTQKIKLNKANAEYIKKIFFGVFENVERLDDIISESAIGWEYSRISKVSMALLRIAVYEILYVDDIPHTISINEAIELSKQYDHAAAYTFINGVLGAVVRNLKRA